MILTCPACAARFLVDPTSIGAGGRTVRCGRCRHAWFVPEPEDLTAAAPPPPPPPPQPPPSAPPVEPAMPAFEEAAEPEAELEEVEREPIPPLLRADDDDEPPPRRAAGARRGRGTTLPAVRRAPSRWPARLAWAALIALLVAIGAGATHYREQIVAAWPAAERLYAAVGIEPAPLGQGLSLVILKSGQVEDGGATVLAVSGRISNTTATTRDVPGLRAVLFDAEERELQHWAFRAPAARLLPKEQVTFETRFKNPSKDAVRLSIVFHAGE